MSRSQESRVTSQRESAATDSYRQPACNAMRSIAGRQSIAVAAFFILFSASAFAEMSPSLLTRLEDDLAGIHEIESTTEKRMACKRVIRRAESLVEKDPESFERFPVLGIMFEAQKIMFTMRQSQETHDALMDTAKKLVEAPDEYASVRVEPDMMLTQMSLPEDKDDDSGSALAIARFADRYRGTPAEATSLMMAASVAFDSGNVDLLKAFRDALTTGFSEDPIVTAFMRERFGVSSTVNFRGVFRRNDGMRISFPIGRPYIMCFWSLDTPMLDQKIAEIKSMQDRYKDQFTVYSFNLDELPDSGANALRRLKLDWVPMKLPGGIENPTYISVGGANMFSGMVVEPHGLARRGATGRQLTSLQRTFDATVRSPRHTTMLRSLCIGDYLVADMLLPGNMTVPTETIAAIRACFPPPPTRYRLTHEQELANYSKAEQLCAVAAAKHPNAPGLWIVQNHRIIALLGLWRISGEFEHLERAVALSKSVLSTKIPPVAAVVPRFCMATRALQEDDVDAGQVLEDLAKSARNHVSRGLACSAALMLSLETHSRPEYLKYRAILLRDHVNDPGTWRITTLLLDRSSSAEVFEKALPGDGAITTEKRLGDSRLFRCDWVAMDGRQVRLPSRTNDVITAVVFAELTGDPHGAASQKRVLDHLMRSAAERPFKDMEVVAVFRGSDTNRVAGLMKQYKWTFRAVCLADTEWERAAKQLGVFSADQRPNVYVAAPSGIMLLALPGAGRDSEQPDTIEHRINEALREHSLALADKALAAGDFAAYAARLETSFPLKQRKRARYEPEWKAPCDHRRKLVWAYMKAGDWQRALKAVTENILAQRPAPHPNDKSKWCRSCHGYLQPFFLRIVLLRKIGADAKKELDAALALVAPPKCVHGRSLDAVWEDAEAYVRTRPENPRFRYLADPKRFLAEHEYNMRMGRQNLYGYGIASDLMTRATIYRKLGNKQQADLDMKNATVAAWPFKVREYDPEQVHSAFIRRSRLAKEHLEAEKWQEALDLVTTNIDMHEAEARRCNSMCKICWAQVQSFGFRARTLDGLGRTKEAEASRQMAELCKCPPGEDLESYKCFPINRMYGGGSGVNRLNFIDTVMTGKNCYANVQHRAYRMEFASDLAMMAEALEGLEKPEEAESARKRAAALAFPKGAKSALADTSGGPERYEDLVRVEE